MTLVEKTKVLLQKYGIKPRKKLGQNFCVDIKLMERIVKYSNLERDDVVLEIGAGLGFFTKILSETAKEVIAVEIDLKLIEALKEELASCNNITIIEDDILKTFFPRVDKIIANPPYSISSRLIPYIFKQNVKRAVVTLQEEFVNRLLAHAGGKEYGNLSVMTYFKAKIQNLEKVPMSSFYPQPEVMSSLILIEPQSPLFNVIDEKFFFDIVKMLFTQRNKKLRNVLESIMSNKMKIKKNEVRLIIEDFPFLELKVFELTPENFGTISNRVYNICEGKRFFFKNRVFYIFPQVYDPSDDTFMLADFVRLEEGHRGLDVCTGCGILGILMAEKAEEVVSIDINSQAVECAKLNAKLNGLADKIEVIHGDLFESINGKFDLITCNPPYLPTHRESNELIAKAWDGGSNGRKVIDRVLVTVPRLLGKNGKILIVQSNLSNIEETIKVLEKQGLKTTILLEEQFEFEKLVVIQAINIH